MTDPDSGAPVHGTPYPPTVPFQAPPPYPTGGGALQPYEPAAPPLPYGQPAPAPYGGAHPLVSPGERLGAALLDVLLAFVTLYVGWLVWSMITWSDGQTPGKKLLNHVTADAHTGQPLDWGQMALREFCVKGLLGFLLGAVTCGVYGLVDACMVFGERQRTLHDKMVNSVVRHA
ncbi:RDD family protein [Asanoa siamensis]|uniref:RDD domain-containing protein n=1 Tax=Asanoa siamensis TaxID=926357 RepID=A0ABQ4CXA1_9ACTN|nr:RDD family protein [Asanoa siamensis]GIF75906.1 hypothetical protein Asi02nite_54240 [Asanoa siamensis]